jgi:hypothetical protein
MIAHPGDGGKGEVPAEVSKRGVMIGNFEGALSSRRKRAAIIIQNAWPKIKKKLSRRRGVPKDGAMA